MVILLNRHWSRVLKTEHLEDNLYKMISDILKKTYIGNHNAWISHVSHKETRDLVLKGHVTLSYQPCTCDMRAAYSVSLEVFLQHDWFKPAD